MSDLIPRRLRDDAERFHGHLGPYLILGMKAGLFANRILGKNPFETKAVVETKLNPPQSCIVDGIQFVTGCTMGKGNIQLRERDNMSIIFVCNGRKLRLRLREEILLRLKAVSSRKEVIETALHLSEMIVQDLFEIDCK